MNKRSRMGIRRSKAFASGHEIPSSRDKKYRARRIMATLDPISFACLQQLSMKHDLPISSIIRFAVEIYLTGNKDTGIASMAAELRRTYREQVDGLVEDRA